jgi:lipoprotein NlpD
MRYQHRFAKLLAGCMLIAALALGGCASKSPAPVVERGGQPVAAAVSGKDLYTVKRGDTLYSIALDHGVDYKDLIVWNSIENPNRIQIGQTLRVRAPGAASGGDVAVARPVVTVPSVEKRSLDGNNTETLKREPKAGKEAYSEQALAQAQGQPKAIEPLAPAAPVVAKPDVKPEPKPEQKAVEPVPGTDEFVWIWPANGKIVGTFSEGASKGLDIAGRAGDPVIAAGDGKVVYSGTGLRGYGKLVIVKHNNTYLSAYAHNQNVLVKEGQAVTKGQKIAEMGNTDADQVKLHFEVRRQGKPVDPLKYLPQR